MPCHLRVQNIGLKTREVLQLVPGTEVEAIERCSGHDGTYGVKKEYPRHLDEDRQAGGRAGAGGGAGPLLRATARWPGHQIETGIEGDKPPTHPLTLLRMAYGI